MPRATPVTEADLEKYRARGLVIREMPKGTNGIVPKPRLEGICEVCSQPFTRTIYEVEKSRVGYCSTRCMGIATRKPCPDVSQLLARYNAGQSMLSISEIWHVSDMTVRRWLMEQGVTIREMGVAVTLAQTGKRHHEAWNQAISQAHLKKRIHHTQGRNNAVFTSSQPSKGRGNGGIRAHLGIYVRSSWENNYAVYLNWRKAQGEDLEWEYEPETFWFKEIARGNRTYTPDFKVREGPRAPEYHEVKGYMDPRSQVKLARMALYHPQVKIVVIDRDFFKACERQRLCLLIPYWECTHTRKKAEIQELLSSEAG